MIWSQQTFRQYLQSTLKRYFFFKEYLQRKFNMCENYGMKLFSFQFIYSLLNNNYAFTIIFIVCVQ